ncbi:MAG: helix-turn-helix domain-containing protein [Thermobispora sp.]|nr:helix-turn-helix domain-containing protein [Thermobispora sp.]
MKTRRAPRTGTIDPEAHRVLGGVSRVAVLETLRRAGRPLAISEIADAVGLHPNTVRAHLALLIEHGHVAGTREDRDRPGRPRTLYTAVRAQEDTDARGYRLLAEILLGYLEHHGDGAGAAVDAGRRYATRALPRDLPAGGSVTVDAIVALLDRAGFEPAVSADGATVELHHCPFRELAQADPETVCAVHLGLLQGALTELGAPAEGVRLTPFARPGQCLVTLADHHGPGRDAPGGREGQG